MLRTAVLTLTIFLMSAPIALANNHDQGQGVLGETNDKQTTDAGFILIIFFPLFVFVCSMIQWRLDVRKERRKAAQKARAARADVRGGW